MGTVISKFFGSVNYATEEQQQQQQPTPPPPTFITPTKVAKEVNGADYSGQTSINEYDNFCTPSQQPNKQDDNIFDDPRSPNIFRTPISELSKNQHNNITKKQNLTTIEMISPTKPSGSNILKDKLLRNIGYIQQNDPRSPSVLIQRTPINFNKTVVDLTLDDSVPIVELDDSVVEIHGTDIEQPKETHQPPPVPMQPIEETVPVEILENYLVKQEKEYLETNFDLIEMLADNLKESLDDPRSPSLNVLRTPLVLKLNNDDCFDIEDSPLILSTITESNELNETKSVHVPIENNENEIVAKENLPIQFEILANKIYSDLNEKQPIICTTPIKNSQLQDKKLDTPVQNRTPLGCLGNIGSVKVKASVKNVQVKPRAKRASLIPVLRD